MPRSPAAATRNFGVAPGEGACRSESTDGMNLHRLPCLAFEKTPRPPYISSVRYADAGVQDENRSCAFIIGSGLRRGPR